MSTALAVYHGPFGRASLYRLNKPMATHAHREGHLIFLVGGGDASVEICGERHAVTRCNAVAVSPWQPHNFVPAPDLVGSVFLILYIKPSWFLDVGRHATGTLRFGRNSVEVTGQIFHLVQLVSSMLAEDSRSDMFDGYLYELTRSSFEQSWQWTSADAEPQWEWQGVGDYRIRKSMRQMRDRLGCGDELVLDCVARDAGLSRPHFYKLFRQHVGLTPNIYLNTLKMESSLDRLTASDDSIMSISLNLGFSSQASFTRFFAANVGMPPTDYRRATSVFS